MTTPAKPQIDTTGLQPTVPAPVSNEIERPYATDETRSPKSMTETAVDGMKDSVNGVKQMMTVTERPEKKDVTVKIEH